jgi:multidrug transporter EmrE-like cation transporter
MVSVMVPTRDEPTPFGMYVVLTALGLLAWGPAHEYIPAVAYTVWSTVGLALILAAGIPYYWPRRK